MSEIDQLIQQIDDVSAKQQLSHAYLIVGSNPINNQKIVQRLASVFLKTEITDQHPDLIEIGLDQETIKIDKVRQVLDLLSRKSLNGDGRVLSIYNADNLNNFSYNALLKSIEEPAADQMIILTTEFLNQIPETIVSRLQILRLDAQADQNDLQPIAEIDEWLQALINKKPEAFALVQLKLINAVEDESVLINQIIDRFAQLVNDNIDNQNYLNALEVVLSLERLRKNNVSLQNSLEYLTTRIEEILND